MSNEVNYILKEEYLIREFNSEYYLINIDNGDIRKINKSGYEILENCGKPKSASDIVSMISKKYGIDYQQQDVLKTTDFLENLVRKEIVKRIH